MYEPVTHYDPCKSMSYDPYGEDISETGYCGTVLSEEYDNSSNDKKHVSCKKCIRLFKKADNEMDSHLQSQLNDMQSFVDFENNQVKN